MSLLEQKKQQFIRWYYGYFVNDPQAETFTFGLHRPLGAMRLTRNIARFQRHWKWMLALAILLVIYALIA